MKQTKRHVGPDQVSGPRRKTGNDFRDFSRRILQYSNAEVTRIDFFGVVSKMIIDFSGCDAVEIWSRENSKYYRCRTTRASATGTKCELLAPADLDDLPSESAQAQPPSELTAFETFCRNIVLARVAPEPPFFTRQGSFWTGDAARPVTYHVKAGTGAGRASSTEATVSIEAEHRSIALIALAVADHSVGLLQLKSKAKDYFTRFEIESYERFGRDLAVALVHQQTQAALHERIKELTCLYGITQISEDPNLPLEGILQRIVNLLPPAWQYPEIASASITVDGKRYQVPNFRGGEQRQEAEIVARGVRRGLVEVVYAEEKPVLDEGPFLKEERGLIEAVGGQIAMIIERRQADEDRIHLQDQLRHADRLATIGQLAAGVAHELNEPLGSILGFAQLVRKTEGVSDRVRQDIEKIIKAALHARQVIQKLMTFARQTPPRKAQVNLNRIVEEGLYFLEARCAKQGIEVARILDPGLPDITADAAQIHQVLVNLAVNAIQAMPGGGKLVLRTARSGDHVSLMVEDTGAGMTEEVMKRVFIPFFTTKDVGQGIGLGLAVVHGIVTGHRGTIKVSSKVGVGSRFEINLPITGPEDKEQVIRE